MTERQTDGHPKPIGPQPFGLGPKNYELGHLNKDADRVVTGKSTVLVMFSNYTHLFIMNGQYAISYVNQL